MKKILSIALTCLIILNTFGFNLLIIFMINESSAENLEMIDEKPESIPANAIVVLDQHNNKIEVLNSREIRYENEMYDVVCRESSGSNTYYYCLKDEKETELRTVFSSLNENTNNGSSNPAHRIILTLKNLLKNYLPVNADHLNSYNNINQFHNINSFNLPLIILIPNSPPPEYQIIC